MFDVSMKAKLKSAWFNVISVVHEHNQKQQDSLQLIILLLKKANVLLIP